VSGRVPIWFGGDAEATFHRAAKYGDGFMPINYPSGDAALQAFDKLRKLTQEAGRDPAAMASKCGCRQGWAPKRTGTARSRSGKPPA
jgi:alkanesulfonate monooxygenase SsuD/methylene tetrahydromethanopterin reductase-like flavin-dependent oxidoreductase (luciferase family)